MRDQEIASEHNHANGGDELKGLMKSSALTTPQEHAEELTANT